MVWEETGKAERVERVDRVRYRLGRQGHSGTAGRKFMSLGLKSESGGWVLLLPDGVLTEARSFSNESTRGIGRVVSLKSGHKE